MSQVEQTAQSNQMDHLQAADKMLLQLRRDPVEFFAEPSLIRHWVRGGDPGEGYSSDITEFSVEALQPPNKSVKVQTAYVRTRFDMEYDPPFLAERFELAADPKDAAKFVIRLLESPVFRKRFAEETPPQVADILKETWVVRHGKTEVSKTFYEPFPKELEELREASRKLAGSLASKGRRTILSTKRQKGGTGKSG